MVVVVGGDGAIKSIKAFSVKPQNKNKDGEKEKRGKTTRVTADTRNKLELNQTNYQSIT